MRERRRKIAKTTPKGKIGALLEVLLAAGKLGLTSFGGPAAHLAYFHHEYVHRRKWMDERSYADLVALCQFLPGPASSQAGIGIGIARAGLLGGFAAWLGFTMPSFFMLLAFAFFLQRFDAGGAGWIHGLKLVAVAIVAHAVYAMGQKLAPDQGRATVAVAAAAAVLLWPSAFVQILVIAAAGLLGLWLFRKETAENAAFLRIPVGKAVALGCLALYFMLLAALPMLRAVVENERLAMFDSFYRAGALVFGGGHVVLPLLEQEVVPTGWVSREAFLAGYGAAQAVPGPLFTFAGYLGAVGGGAAEAAIALAGIFLPGFLLVAGALPFWNELRKSAKLQGALAGINAAVVGILLAALYNPLWTSAVREPADFAMAAALFAMLAFWKLPPLAVVAAGAAGGALYGL